MAVKKEENPTGASKGTIKKHIMSGEFSKVYLMYGAEQYLATFYRDQIKNALVNADDDLNCRVYDSDSFDLNTLINDSITMPFFAEHRVVVVNGSGYFDGSDPEFIENVGQIPDSNVVIFCEQKVNKAKKAYLAASKCPDVTCLEFKGLEKNDLITWLATILGDGGLKVKLSVPEKILDACGSGADMYMLENEAKKVHDYCMDKGVVSPEDVELLCSNAIEDKIFDMCRAISQKDSSVAISQYEDLLKLKKNVVTIMIRIEAQYNQLLDIKILLEEGKKESEIADKMRLSKWVVSRLVSLAKSYTRKELIAAVDACQEAMMLKTSGGLLGNSAVENLIVKLLTTS
ncbi:MAG: DNA polymerase III subunit delta [Eubacterium sp.]|nr:DNA polymerase III subunit delta [Eubacterium sp.]